MTTQPTKSDLRASFARPAEVADLFDVSIGTLAQWRYEGRGPKFTKAGNRILYRWADVEAFLDANMRDRT